MSSLKERIDEVLEHYEYALVSLKGESTDNILYVETPVSIKPLYRYLTILYGDKRVSIVKGKVRVDEKTISI